MEFGEWYYATDIHEGTATFYNYFFDLGDKVAMFSIEDLGNGNTGAVQYIEGSYKILEEDILDNYDLEPVDIKLLEHIFIKKVLKNG